MIATPSPPPYVAPTPVPLRFAPTQPVRIELDKRPLGVSPDGDARWLVRVVFRDADGKITHIDTGGDFDFVPSRGVATWQPRVRFDGPSAIVRTDAPGPLTVTVTARDPASLGTATASTDPAQWAMPRFAASAVGPHDVQIGWFARANAPRIVRTGPNGKVALDPAGFGARSTHDTTVVPGTRYRYDIVDGAARASLTVDVPPEPTNFGEQALRGKGLWLAYSPKPTDNDAFTKLDPANVIAHARAAGLRYVELRVLYGELGEITPAAKPVVDALIDGLRDAGIATIAWTVPRRPSFEELSATTQLLAYHTAHGNGFSGLAVDFERGEEFLGAGDSSYGNIADFARLLRGALGARYPIVAIVEDPWIENLTDAVYPYRAIASSTAIMQPMVYWRARARDASISGLTLAIQNSNKRIQREAGKLIDVNVGAQTTALGPLGAPTPAEVRESILVAHNIGAFGITFYDWYGTSDAQWEAIGATPW